MPYGYAARQYCAVDNRDDITLQHEAMSGDSAGTKFSLGPGMKSIYLKHVRICGSGTVYVNSL